MKILSHIKERFKKKDKTPYIQLSQSERHSFEDSLMLSSFVSKSFWDLMRQLSDAHGLDEWKINVSGFIIHFRYAKENPDSFSISYPRETS